MVVVFVIWCAAGAVVWAEEPGVARQPRSYDDMERLLHEVSERPEVSLEVAGQSVEGRAIFAVRLGRSTTEASWRVLFFGQQHGDEPAGKEALLDLILTIADDPSRLPDGVELWVVPQVNPDGAAAGKRRSSAGADLNRDHLLLRQPETLALHRLARRVRPDIVVDCHEFSRDSRSYTEHGWFKWPTITMGTANHPALPDSIFEVGLQWVEAARQPMAAAGISYERYLVGGAPPNDEMRPSTLEANDGRNGLASLGSLGFIIESGRYANADDPNHDLHLRVEGYLVLLWRFLEDTTLRQASLDAVAEARSGNLPRFVGANVFWGNNGLRTAQVKVIRQSDGAVISVETANLMHDRVVKRAVELPAAYCIVAEEAEVFAELLDRHGLSYVRLATDRELDAAGFRLVAVEAEDDPLYERYAGRQIVQPAESQQRRFAAGSLLVTVDQPHWARVVQLLEPRLLYGLFQYKELRKTVSWNGWLPIWCLDSLPG
jgi:hypothetical protein